MFKPDVESACSLCVCVSVFSQVWQVLIHYVSVSVCSARCSRCVFTMLVCVLVCSSRCSRCGFAVFMCVSECVQAGVAGVCQCVHPGVAGAYSLCVCVCVSVLNIHYICVSVCSTRCSRCLFVTCVCVCVSVQPGVAGVYSWGGGGVNVFNQVWQVSVH